MKKILVLLFSVCVLFGAQIKEGQKGSFEGVFLGVFLADCGPTECLAVKIHDGKNIHEILLRYAKMPKNLSLKMSDDEVNKIGVGSKVRANFTWAKGSGESGDVYPAGLYPSNVKLKVLKAVNNEKLKNTLQKIQALMWDMVNDDDKPIGDVMNLASWYENGKEGLPKDLKEAKNLYAEAVERGGGDKARQALDRVEKALSLTMPSLADLEGSWGEGSGGAYFVFDDKGGWESYYASGASENTGKAVINGDEVEMIPDEKEDPLDETKKIKRDNFKLKIEPNALGEYERYVSLESGLNVLVTDSDKKGANVRSEPKGDIIANVPYVSAQADQSEIAAKRMAYIQTQRGDWFFVTFGGVSPHPGWMHKSLLGSCILSSQNLTAIKNLKGEVIAEVPVISARIEAIKEPKDGKRIVKIKTKDGIIGWVDEESLFNRPAACKAWE